MLDYYNEIEKAIESASDIYEGAKFFFENAYTIIIIGAIALAVILVAIWNLHKRINELQYEIIETRKEIQRAVNTINMNNQEFKNITQVLEIVSKASKNTREL